MPDRGLFEGLADRVASACGQPRAFLAAALIVVVWAVTGPVFGFSDTWQLVINTGTTIVTFLMCFLIQNAQDRHTREQQDEMARDLACDTRTEELLLEIREMLKERQ